MKKILFILMSCNCIHIFAMDPSAYEARLRNVETAVTEIKNILNDTTSAEGEIIQGLQSQVKDVLDILNDKTNPDTGEITLGVKSQVEINTTKVNAMQESIQSISTGVSALATSMGSLSSQVLSMLSTIEGVEKKIDSGWDEFLEEKFQEYMEIKKKVLDIITNCKTNGQDTPTYITETADQLKECNLQVRRETLSDILTKLNVFETLLDESKLQSIQTYLDNTSVSEPKLQEIKAILPMFVVEGEYLKVSGATRTFTRSSGFKTGLPKQGWMDQSCDYFAYGLRPVLERKINEENLKRRASNAAIESQNSLAKAKYNAEIKAAERVSFPSDEFTSLVTEYNRLLTRHEI